jgi:membrane fusion protein (multidrug efflux system)
MTEHARSFEIDRVVPAAEAVALQRAQPAGEGVLPHPEAKKNWPRRLLVTGASLVALAGAAYFGWHYWTVGRFEVSTDDAYVKADNTTIAPKISGYLAAVLVGDNERSRPARSLPGSTIATSRWRLIKLKPMWLLPARPLPASRPR